jgi:hypothetical protein
MGSPVAGGAKKATVTLHLGQAFVKEIGSFALCGSGTRARRHAFFQAWTDPLHCRHTAFEQIPADWAILSTAAWMRCQNRVLDR